MKVEYEHISAFTRTPGQGNPAAVCVFERWPTDAQLSRLARGIALPVTACLVPVDDGMELRWMSMAGTFVQSMCGHGTLAASCVMSMRRPDLSNFEFRTPGGRVAVRRDGDLFLLDLPRWNSQPVSPDPALSEALGSEPIELYEAGRDTLSVYASEEEVRRLKPDMQKLRSLGRRGFIATAAGHEYDCVSRFFCPSFGIGVDEDPVTGSAHCSIAPLWAKKLGKDRIRALQASPMGGELLCEVGDSTVTIGAPAVAWSHGSVVI